MSASAKIILRKKPNAVGQYPLAIRITLNRRSSYKLIGHYIDLEDWDDKNSEVKKSHPNSESINILLTTRLTEAKKGLINLQIDDKEYSANQIKAEIYKPISRLYFFDYAKEHLEALKAEGNVRRHPTDLGLVSYVKKFHKSTNLSFEEINQRFLKKLKVYLKGKCKLSETSAMNVMVLIRLLYNRAINDNTASKDLYPFGKGKFKIKFPETQKVGLNIEEILRIEQLENLSLVEFHTRNVWLFSFNFAGMRVSDVLKTRWKDIYDNRLHYRMNKNSKLLSLKIPKKVHPILKHYINYKVKEDDFIFPELKKANLSDPKDVYNKIKAATKKFNKNLKSIAKKAETQKKLTMHIARHSFGNIAGDAIHPLMLQKLYRHSDLKTTLNYQANFIHKEADEALDSVVNF